MWMLGSQFHPGILKGLGATWSSVCYSGFEGSLFHTASLVAIFWGVAS